MYIEISNTKVKESVWVVVITYEGKLLITKRSKQSNNSNLLNFVGGGIEKGEKPIHTTYRELQEEVGIKRSMTTYKDLYKIKTNKRLLHVLVVSVSNPKIKLQKKETSDYYYKTLDQIYAIKKSKLHKQTFLILKKSKPRLEDAIEGIINERV